MSAFSFDSLIGHFGHDVSVVKYEHKGFVDNVAIECETCKEVLLDFDAEEAQTWPGNTSY